MAAKKNKQARRKKFEVRHVDQLWSDIRKDKKDVTDGNVGPIGTTDKGELDEDIPGYGKYYCVPCSRYFISASALVDHEQSKPHKKLVKRLRHGIQPHNQLQAEMASGMGKPDNGVRTQRMDLG